MPTIHLDSRLSAIAQAVRPHAYFADIGTDHGYLPVSLVLQGKINTAIAADVNEKPLDQARQTIARYGLEDSIIPCLSDGLQKVDPAVESIAIAGMGGELIASILSAVEWVKDSSKQLLLQPMTQDTFLRVWLAQEGFALLDETIAADQGHLYTVMEVRYTGAAEQLTPAEAYVGKALDKDDPLSLRYIEKKKDKLRKIAAGLQRAGKMAEAEEKLRLLTEIAAVKGQ